MNARIDNIHKVPVQDVPKGVAQEQFENLLQHAI